MTQRVEHQIIDRILTDVGLTPLYRPKITLPVGTQLDRILERADLPPLTPFERKLLDGESFEERTPEPMQDKCPDPLCNHEEPNGCEPGYRSATPGPLTKAEVQAMINASLKKQSGWGYFWQTMAMIVGTIIGQLIYTYTFHGK